MPCLAGRVAEAGVVHGGVVPDGAPGQERNLPGAGGTA